MGTGITVSIWGLKSSWSPFPYGDHRMETGIDASPFPYGDHRYHMGIRHPLPYGDPDMGKGLPYPHMEMVNHRFHMGIEKFMIPVSIWGSPYGKGDKWIPVTIRGSRCHIPMWKWLITVSIRGLKSSWSPFPYGDHRMETGIDASSFPYGDYPVPNPIA
jgi:hypothetical protein